MEIAILGGGHGCYAAAADLSERGHSVRFWRRDATAFGPVLDSKRVTLKDGAGRREVGIARPTDDLAEAVNGAALIVIPLPATAQAGLFSASRRSSPRVRSCSCRPALSAAICFTRRHATRATARASRLRRPALCLGCAASTVRPRSRSVVAQPGCRREFIRRRSPNGLSTSCAKRSRGRAARRRARRRADERRADHPSAAHPHERRASGAFRSLGHPQ